MAWYPGAVKMELQPESDSQPAIKPTQFIVHSLAAPWTARRTYEYWRDSTNLESHFGLGYEGDLGQYIGTQTKADANAAANLRPDGTGAVSIETASNLNATDAWTPAQVEQLIKLGVWVHQTHGIPLRLCRSASDPGFGYHRQFAAWNPNSHACPGPARIAQFTQVVFPNIVARATANPAPPTEEEDVPTAEEIAARVWDHPVQVLDTDEEWTAAAQIRAPHKVLRRVEEQLAEQGAAIATLTALVNQLLAAQNQKES